MFALKSQSARRRWASTKKRGRTPIRDMEVVSINEFDRQQLHYQDRITMESAVDQLEALSRPETQNTDMVIQFGEMKVDDSPLQLFEFELPSACRKWPGPRFGSLSLHKQIPTSRSRLKASGASSQKKKHGRLEDHKFNMHPRKATTPKSRDARIPAPTPTFTSPIASRNPPLRLMDLPPEVRNEIWTLLAVREDPIEAQFRRIRPCKKRGDIVICRFPREPPLATANKKVRKEVLSLFYGLNKFVFETSGPTSGGDLDMTKISTIQKWKPRADVASFISQVDIRLMLGEAGSMLTVYEIRRMANADIIVNATYAASKKKKAVSTVARMCLCGEKAVAEFSEGTHDKSDLIETAVSLLQKRMEVHPASTALHGGICLGCGRIVLSL